MSSLTDNRIRLGLAFARGGAGGVFRSTRSARCPTTLRKLDRKTADLATLRPPSPPTTAAARQALAPFEALATKQPPSLTELAAKTLPGSAPASASAKPRAPPTAGRRGAWR